MSLYLSSRAPARRTTRASGEVPLLVAHLRFFGDRGGLAPATRTVEELNHAMGAVSYSTDDAAPSRIETSKVLPILRARFKTPGARAVLDRVQMWAEGLGEYGNIRWSELLWDAEVPYM